MNDQYISPGGALILVLIYVFFFLLAKGAFRVKK